MKKPILLPILTILIFALVLAGASAGLAGVYQGNAGNEHIAIMKTLLPGSETFVVEPYTGADANIRSVHKGETGYVIETVTYGYAGEITMLISVSNSGQVVGLVVRDMSETPGLGGNALTDADFLAQFLNTSGNVSIAVSDADTGATGQTETVDAYVDGITGATVTSKAIARSVNSAVAYVTGADVETSATGADATTNATGKGE